MRITYSVDGINQFNDEMKNRQERYGNMKRFMRSLSVKMYADIINNFKTESDGVNKWEPLSEFTKWVKKFRVKSPETNPRLLQDTGHLKGSITSQSYDDATTSEAKVFTNLAYAELMQRGGKSKPNEVMVRPYRYGHAGESFSVRKKYLNKKPHMLEIKGGYDVPARPFMNIPENKMQEYVGQLRDYIYGK